MQLIISVLLSILVLSNAIAAEWNLDERLARKLRYSQYSAAAIENGTTYIWQPESLIFTDPETGHEITLVAWNPNNGQHPSKEHAAQAWSHNGAVIGFHDFGCDRGELKTGIDPTKGACKYLVRSDGSNMRVSDGYGKFIDPYEGFSWAHTELAYYTFGSRVSGGSDIGDGYGNILYKVTLNPTTLDATNTQVVSLSSLTSLSFDNRRDSVSPDDSHFYGITGAAAGWSDPNTTIDSFGVAFVDLNAKSVTGHWGVGRGIAPFDTLTAAQEVYFRDVRALGNSQDWLLGQYGNNPDIWWLWKKSGSSPDGGPAFENWDGDSWGTNQEIRAYADASPFANPYSNPYFGHPDCDRWGKYCIVGLIDDTYQGAYTFDVASSIASNVSGRASNKPLSQYYDGQHHSWKAWSDYVVGHDTNTSSSYVNRLIANTYTGNSGTVSRIARTYLEPGTTGQQVISNNYSAYARPVQSPDGTKVEFTTFVFNPYTIDWSSANGRWELNGSIESTAYAVAYYPHPPEITQVTNNSGTYTIRFDWRLGTTPRGYTTRGWPSEATNNPPPPRETKLFRLWRSSTGTGGWTPVGTVNADIFTRYNFATGAWSGNDYWTITDTPGAGTWYYAVTSQEWSGLESRTLSNVFSTAGTQTAAYPSDPKGSTNFCTDFQSSLTRHYNIYAKDGSTPTAVQTSRIASIPVASPKSFVDWMGNADGSTQYLVTPVDSQGNEGSSLNMTRTVLATAGQYQLTWDDSGGESTPPTSFKGGKAGGKLLRLSSGKAVVLP